jgi:8-amino-7-oxononanoate synthase
VTHARSPRPGAPSRGPLAHLEEALGRLEREGLRRRPLSLEGGDASFCSNDYLGLASRLAPRVPVGAGASRLISGDHEAHRRLEEALTRWLGCEAVLVFSSGYAANVGTIAALAAPGDLVVSDALNHASIIDGARLSRARIVVTPHNDVEAIGQALRDRAEPRAWVLVESYYSMDADGPDLRALRDVTTETGAALVVDEAHALGVLGPEGRGRCAEAGIVPDVLVGTLGKAFGSQGAFVAGSAVLRDWLWNRARSFVFSTGLSPASATAAHDAVSLVERDPTLGARGLALAARLRAGLAALPHGLRPTGFGHIVPLVIGDSERAMRLAALLREEGYIVPAIRPPTVPRGTARLRLTVTAAHDEGAVDRLAAAVRRAVEKL